MNFEFCVAGRSYAVSTKVGNGVAVVVVRELDQKEDVQLEPPEDAS